MNPTTVAASATILNQGTTVIPTPTLPGLGFGGTDFIPFSTLPIGNSLTKTVTQSEGLPTIFVYLFLHATYEVPNIDDPENPLVFLPSRSIEWRPLIQVGTNTSGQPGVGLPLTAPMILPINTPIFYSLRAPLTNSGFTIYAYDDQRPGVTGYNKIDYIVSLAQ
jgi:hypothetical protein